MKWRRREWEDGVYSTVILNFIQLDDALTEIHLEQKNIPKFDKFNNAGVIENVETGWVETIFRKISMFLGYTFQTEKEFE